MTALPFFVALTRARRSLHLLVSAKAAGSKSPHSFIADLPEDCCDFFVYKKTGRTLDDLGGREAFDAQFGIWERVKARFGSRRRR